MTGYKVMRLHRGMAISGADSRAVFTPAIGMTIRMPPPGMWLSLDRQYAVDHYAVHDRNILLTFEFEDAVGSLTDRETEFTVASATLTNYEEL